MCTRAHGKEIKFAREKGKNVPFAKKVSSIGREKEKENETERDLANVCKLKRTEKGREECKDLGCSPCRRPRAIDSRASRPLRGRGTRERGTREGIPAGEGGGKAAANTTVGPGERARARA